MTVNPILIRKKLCRMKLSDLHKQQGLSLDETMELFYHSEAYPRMREVFLKCPL